MKQIPLSQFILFTGLGSFFGNLSDAVYLAMGGTISITQSLFAALFSGLMTMMLYVGLRYVDK